MTHNVINVELLVIVNGVVFFCSVKSESKSDKMMATSKKIAPLKQQHLDARLIQQHLDKVTKWNRCLICEVNFIDNISVYNHFLDVHHKDVFVCNISGCTYVTNTNGDLRMHCLIWHSSQHSPNVTLPRNSMSITNRPKAESTNRLTAMTSAPRKTLISDAKASEIPNPIVTITAIRKTSAAKPIKIETQQPKEKQLKLGRTVSQTMYSPILTNLKCSTCKHPFLTELGINMHQKYHRFNSFLPKLKKMSDIETLDELKNILEINDEKSVVENRFSIICTTNKENTPVGNAIVDKKRLERPQQRKQVSQQRKQVTQQQQQQQQQHHTTPMPQNHHHRHQQQQQKENPIKQPTKQKQQWTEMFNLTKVNIAKNLQNYPTPPGVQKVINVVDKPVPIQPISTNVREIRIRPLSPAGSVVSVSSDETGPTENEAMDYSCEEVDIEF